MGGGGLWKSRRSKGGYVNFILHIRSKCGQGGRGSKYPKNLPTSYLEAPLPKILIFRKSPFPTPPRTPKGYSAFGLWSPRNLFDIIFQSFSSSQSCFIWMTSCIWIAKLANSNTLRYTFTFVPWGVRGITYTQYDPSGTHSYFYRICRWLLMSLCSFIILFAHLHIMQKAINILLYLKVRQALRHL